MQRLSRRGFSSHFDNMWSFVLRSLYTASHKANGRMPNMSEKADGEAGSSGLSVILSLYLFHVNIDLN